MKFQNIMIRIYYLFIYLIIYLFTYLFISFIYLFIYLFIEHFYFVFKTLVFTKTQHYNNK